MLTGGCLVLIETWVIEDWFSNADYMYNISFIIRDAFHLSWVRHDEQLINVFSIFVVYDGIFNGNAAVFTGRYVVFGRVPTPRLLVSHRRSHWQSAEMLKHRKYRIAFWNIWWLVEKLPYWFTDGFFCSEFQEFFPHEVNNIILHEVGLCKVRLNPREVRLKQTSENLEKLKIPV